MKNLCLAIAASLALLTGTAMAADAEGTIQSVDVANYSMSLDDGQTYQLPAEFDISLIGQGMRVALAYDEVDGTKMVTDMEQVD